MTDHWHRFEEGGRGHRKVFPNVPDNSSAWIVLWDNDPKFYFTTCPNNWGGSGWFANPIDVIAKPEDISNG